MQVGYDQRRGIADLDGDGRGRRRHRRSWSRPGTCSRSRARSSRGSRQLARVAAGRRRDRADLRPLGADLGDADGNSSRRSATSWSS